MLSQRRLPVWGVAACAVMLGGCFPDYIVWAPDSSGIAFSKSEDDSLFAPRKQITSIYHYNLKSKALRVVVSQKGRTGTKLPAISPDGKRVAVAQVWTWSRGQYVQVRTYRLDGSIDVASDPFRLFSFVGPFAPHKFAYEVWARKGSPAHPTGWTLGCTTPKEPPPPRSTGAFEVPDIVESTVQWSPDGRYLLADSIFGCIRYEMSTGKFRQFAPSVTVGHRMLLEHSILPNSRGFLASWAQVGLSPNSPVPDWSWPLKNLILVDWEGVSRRFTFAPGAEEALTRFVAELESDFERDTRTLRQKARWEGALMILPLREGSLRIDPETRTITYRDDPKVATLANWARHYKVDAVERFGDDGTGIVAWQGRLDVKVRRGKWETLANGVGGAEIYPSPDRRYVAVRYTMNGNVRRTMIVDADCAVVGEFDIQ